MTKKELKQIRYLKREIADLDREIRVLEGKATSTTQTITGMPFTNTGSDKTSIGADIADLRIELKNQKQRLNREYSRLKAYIYSIDDSYIRQILKYRFIKGWSWARVAYKMGGNNTEDSVRMACDRYINRNL